MIKWVIIAIVIYIILKIHEVYLVYKWTDISSIDEDADSDDIIKNLSTQIKERFTEDTQEEKEIITIPIYGPFSKASASTRATNCQFIENSIVIINEDNKYYPYKSVNNKLVKCTTDDLDEATRDYCKQYIEKHLNDNKLSNLIALSFEGVFTQDEYEMKKNNNEFNDKSIFGIYLDNEKKSFKMYQFHTDTNEITEVYVEESEVNYANQHCKLRERIKKSTRVIEESEDKNER